MKVRTWTNHLGELRWQPVRRDGAARWVERTYSIGTGETYDKVWSHQRPEHGSPVLYRSRSRAGRVARRGDRALDEGKAAHFWPVCWDGGES